LVSGEAEAVDVNEVAVGEEVEPLEVGDELFLGEEDLLLAVATLVDMVNVTTVPIASPGCRNELLVLHTNK
jgi:hypothetical protein